MVDLFQFDPDMDLDRPDQPEATKTPTAATTLEKWADDQLADNPATLFFDIETGPLPEDQLRAMYHEKTLEEFSATCDKRWKSDTVAKKYEEYKASAWNEFASKAALSPITGRVLLVGLVQNGVFAYFGNEDERANLEEYWTLTESTLDGINRIIGHNSNGFDLPFLVRRSWILGVPVPREVRHGRYWNPLFLDTMEAWGCGSRDFIRLNDLAACFGVGQKTEGVHGRDFSKLWFGQMPAEKFGTPDEQRTKAIEYCEQDVRLTAAIAAKMGLV